MLFACNIFFLIAQYILIIQNKSDVTLITKKKLNFEVPLQILSQNLKCHFGFSLENFVRNTIFCMFAKIIMNEYATENH